RRGAVAQDAARRAGARRRRDGEGRAARQDPGTEELPQGRSAQHDGGALSDRRHLARRQALSRAKDPGAVPDALADRARLQAAQVALALRSSSRQGQGAGANLAQQPSPPRPHPRYLNPAGAGLSPLSGAQRARGSPLSGECTICSGPPSSPSSSTALSASGTASKTSATGSSSRHDDEAFNRKTRQADDQVSAYGDVPPPPPPPPRPRSPLRRR